MKKSILTGFLASALIALSVSSFAYNHGANNNDLLFAKAQSMFENITNVSDLKNLPENEKVYFNNMYVISLKSGEIVYTPANTLSNTPISAEEAIVIVDKTVKAWQFDESKTVYDVGNYLTSVVVMNSRDVYVLVIPDIYQSMKFKKPF